MADDSGDGPRRGAPLRRRRGRRRRRPADRLRRRCARMVDDAARALLASGIERGDRVAVWAPNSLEWIVAALGVTTAGGVLVPVNTRFRGAEAAFVLARSGARALFTVRGFLDTDYPALLASAGVELPALEHTILLAGDARRRVDRAGTTSSPRGSAVPDARSRRARRVDRPRRPERRRVHVGDDRQPQGRRDDARPDAARVPRLVRLGRPPRRRPLPDRRTRSSTSSATRPGCLACLMRGATIFPLAVFDAGRRARARRARADLGAARTADDLPLAARPSRPRRAATSRACGVAVTGAADIPVELIRRVREELPFERILTGYGLTEAGTVTGSRPDDDFEHIATTVGVPWPGFEVRIVDRVGRRRRGGRAGRSRRARRDRDARLPRRPGGDRGRDRRRRVAAHRRPRHDRRRRLPAHRRAHQGHVHRRRVQRVPRRDREPDAAPPAHRAGRGDRRARRAPRRGRRWRSSCSQPGPPIEPAEIIEWARGEMANFKVPRVGRVPRRAAGERDRQGRQGRAAGARATS